VAPAAGFYSSEGKGLQEIRIAYVLEEKALRKAIEILKKAVETYNAK
jgi:aspartate aminotransferase